MSGFGNFINTNTGAVGGVFSSLISSIASSITANRQNRKNRKFQAEQAQLARDWQEDMYNKYSSPSAMVQQYQDAGLNPALAYGGQTGQTFSANSGQTSGSQMMPDFSGLDLSQFISALAGLKIEGKKANAQVTAAEAAANRDNAEANYFNKQASAIDIENQFKPQILEQNLKAGKLNIDNLEKGLIILDTKIDLMKSEIIKNYGSFRNYISSSNLNDSLRNKVTAEIKKIGEETFLTQLKQGAEVLQSVLTYEQSKTEVAKRDKLYVEADLVREDVIRERWYNKMREDHHIDPSLCQTYWGLLFSSLLGIYLDPDDASSTLIKKFSEAFKLPDDYKSPGSTRIQNNE